MLNEYVKAIEAILDEDQKDMLKRVYAPTVVAVPLTDAYCATCVLPTGEIRSYGFMDGTYNGDYCGNKYGYLSSVDGGISWTKHYAKGEMGPCAYIYEKDLYIKTKTIFGGEDEGFYIYLSNVGADDPSPRVIKVSDLAYHTMFLPQKSEYTDRIWITTQRLGEDCVVAAYIYSDDFGENWNIVEFEVPRTFERVYPHKGDRWHVFHGVEPYAVELSEGKMMMLIRSYTDNFQQCFSYDGGVTWTTPEKSVFHGTNTTPFFLKMSDGKIITFWNNTQPMPEMRQDKMTPPWDTNGEWEDVFTNRDVCHVAISDDCGESWVGFRELYRNSIRNNSDYRRYSDTPVQSDKSVHQFQAFELPFGKVLVHLGQNSAARRMVIFDREWLYENSSKEDFSLGLGNVSTHVYLKSISGCKPGVNGHCCWNRTNGAVMMPDPDGGFEEFLLISKHHDDRLLSDVQGVVWNFPTSKTGTVMAELRLVEKRIRISLTDRWFNPCDEYCGELAQASFEIDTNDVEPDVFTKVYISYDTEKRFVQVRDDERVYFNVKMKDEAPVGFSYIIIQCATDGESKGAYLKKFEKTNEVKE